MSAVCDAGASKPSPGLSCGTVGGSSGGKPSSTLYLTVRSGCGGTKLGAREVAGGCGCGCAGAGCLTGCVAGGAACFGVSAASFCGGAVASSGAAAGAGGGGGGGADFEERSTASEGSCFGSSGFGGASSLGGAPTSAGETRSTVIGSAVGGA